jgi:adenylylsulfate kinase
VIDKKATNVVWHEGDLSREVRWPRVHGRGATLWFTGLSASGKSTIACALEAALVERGQPAYRLDGDNIRHGLNKNLGFSATDRAENIRRIGEVAKLFADAGTLAITAFISPYIVDRDHVRALHDEAKLTFLEVFVDAPIDVCEARDPKGMYKKARAGIIKGFTGIDDPYEAPKQPELVLKTGELTVEESVASCFALLKARDLLLPARA